MDELADMHCTTITKTTPPLNKRDIDHYHAQVEDWRIYEKDGEPRLEKSFAFKNFGQALTFTNRVGQAAETENHHPAILCEWGRVTVTWWTHRVKGLTQNDFIMAAKTDQLFTEE